MSDTPTDEGRERSVRCGLSQEATPKMAKVWKARKMVFQVKKTNRGGEMSGSLSNKSKVVKKFHNVMSQNHSHLF